MGTSRILPKFNQPAGRLHVVKSAPERITPQVARSEVARLSEEVRRLQESSALALDNQYWWRNLDPYAGFDRGGYGYAGGGYGYGADRAQDTTHSPLPFLTEQQWRWSLALVRQLAQQNHLVIGFRDHVSSFIGPVSVQFVDKGGAPGPTASGPLDADGDGSPDVSAAVQMATEAWEEFCEANDWGVGETDREEECRKRLILEGEATLAFAKGGEGEVPRVWHVEPELIRSPVTAPKGFGWAEDEDWKWGVLTKPNDAERALALWVADPDGADGWVLEANRFVRARGNVDRCVKRGMSDFFATTELVEKTRLLLENMAHVAQLQAKIAWWEKFASATQAQIDALVSSQRTHLVPGVPVSPYAGSAAQAGTSVQDYPQGAVVRTEQRDVLPGPTSSPEGFIAIEQAVMRSVSFRFGLPSSFTGDADSFASALVTGAPFVRIIQGRQKKQEGFTRDVVIRVLQLCEESRRLPPGISRAVKPVLTSQPVVIADEEKQSRTFLAELDKGVADPIEYIKKRGGDPKVVLANLASWKQKVAQMGQPPGQQPPPGGGLPPPLDPTPTPPGSAGGDGSSPNRPDAGNIFGEGGGADVLREGFTGVDSHGHHWVDGKQVKRGDEPKSDGGKGGAKPAAPNTPRVVSHEPREMDPAFSKAVSEHQAKLTSDELAAVKQYTGGAHHDLNDALRRGRDPSALRGRADVVLSGAKPELAAVHAGLQAAYDSAPDLNPPVVAYRGIGLSAKDTAALLEAAEECAASGGKKMLRFAGWQSTTIRQDRAADFARRADGDPVVLEIAVRKGAYLGATRENTKGVSAFANEAEIPLPHNQAYRVAGTERRRVKDGLGGTREVTVLKLEQVPGSHAQEFPNERPLRKGFLGLGGQKGIKVTSTEAVEGTVESSSDRFTQDTLDGVAVVES